MSVLLLGCPGLGTENQIEDEKDARRVAAQFFGFFDDPRLEPTRIRVDSCPIPFVGAAYDGADAWSVRVEGLELEFGEGEQKHANPHISGFRATFSAESGALLWMESIPTSKQLTLPELPDRAWGEKVMAASPGRFVGIPAEPPGLSIRELLTRAWEQGHARIDAAQEIRIKYVLYSNPLDGIDSEPTWIINVRGIPPIPGKGPGALIPPEDRSRLRLFYDDAGTLLGGDNLLP